MPSPHYLSLNVIKIHFCHQKEQGCHHKGVSMCVFVCVCLNIKQHQFIWQFCKSRTNRTNHHEFIKCEGAFWYFFFFFACAYCSLFRSRKQHVEIIMIIIINMQIRCKKRQTLLISQHRVSWLGSKERFTAVSQEYKRALWPWLLKMELQLKHSG